MRLIKYSLPALFASLFSITAAATGTGPYFGIQIGQTDMSNKEYYVNTGLPNPFPPTKPAKTVLPHCYSNDPRTCITTPGKVKPTNTGIGERLYAGIQVNRYAGFEMGATAYAPSVYDPKIQDSNEPAIRGYAFDIMGKLAYDLSRFTVFGKAGGVGTRQTATGALTNVSKQINFVPPEFVKLNQVKSSTNSGHLMAAVGISVDLTANWVFDITASKIFGGSSFPDATFYGMGISYHWVDLYCGQFLC